MGLIKVTPTMAAMTVRALDAQMRRCYYPIKDAPQELWDMRRLLELEARKGGIDIYEGVAGLYEEKDSI